MNRFYAHINTSNIVTGMLRTHDEILVSDMIEVPAYDEGLIGNLFNPADGSFTPQPDPPIRKITTQAFYRRMTPAERNAIRTNLSDPVQDLRDDLSRSPAVNLDGTIEQQLLDTGGFTQTRIDELLIDGTEAEQGLQ